MIDLLIALGGSALALFIFSLFRKNAVVKGQKELEEKVAKIVADQKQIEAEIVKTNKEAQDKVNELETDKNKDPSGSDLVDFFNNRKR